jgi:DsbC/DsbD-like thiol-disulfide interchange protein
MLHRCVIRGICNVFSGAACVLLSTIAIAQNPGDEHVKVELVSEKQAIEPHQQLWLGIRFDLQEGWHTYWINPGDSGEPPQIDWTLPTGFQANSIQWPYPTRLSTPPFVDYGYEHQVLLPVLIRTPAGLTAGTTEKVIANVHYLICREVCIPGQKRLELELPVKNQSSPGSGTALFKSTRRQLPQAIPANWKISAISTGDELRLRLRSAKVIASPKFFPLEPEQIENAAPQNVSTTQGGVDLSLKKSNHLLKAISHLKGVIVVAGTAYAVDVPVSESGRGSRSKQN